MMENKNPMLRLVIFGRFKKMIQSYYGTRLKSIDRRLFRGLFVRNFKDFDEDYRENLQNKSLFQRLKLQMFPKMDNERMWNNNTELISQMEDSKRVENNMGLRLGDSAVFNGVNTQVMSLYYQNSVQDSTLKIRPNHSNNMYPFL